MIKKTHRELHLNNLREIFEKISHLEAFVFFGTLLGYQREGNIIAYDNDVDIYVNAKQEKLLFEALIDSKFDMKLLPENYWYLPKRTPLVLQLSRWQEGIQTFVDLYLYNDNGHDFIIEKWNFMSQWKNPRMALHIPKSLIFPLSDAEMKGVKIRIPSKSEETCNFLYGPEWRVPMKKDQGYMIKLINNIPEFKANEIPASGWSLLLEKFQNICRRIYYRF